MCEKFMIPIKEKASITHTNNAKKYLISKITYVQSLNKNAVFTWPLKYVSIFNQHTKIANDEINRNAKLSSEKALLWVYIISKMQETMGKVYVVISI